MDFLGDLVGGLFSYAGAVKSNVAAKNQAQAQMDFQERMSNTAHQREVKDLSEAGLNPILSAKLGGASTPPGAAAPVENALGQGVNTAMALRRQRADLESIQAAVEKTRADTKNANELTKSTLSLNRAQKLKTLADASQSNYSARSLELGLPALENAATFEQNLRKISPNARGSINLFKDLLGAISSAKSIASPPRPPFVTHR